mgnify:CR=1 FL=1
MELTDEQIERQDIVDNTIHEMLIGLIPNDKTLDWDIEIIGRVRDVVEHIFVKKHICTDYEFYPYIEE